MNDPTTSPETMRCSLCECVLLDRIVCKQCVQDDITLARQRMYGRHDSVQMHRQKITDVLKLMPAATVAELPVPQSAASHTTATVHPAAISHISTVHKQLEQFLNSYDDELVATLAAEAVAESQIHRLLAVAHCRRFVCSVPVGFVFQNGDRSLVLQHTRDVCSKTWRFFFGELCRVLDIVSHQLQLRLPFAMEVDGPRSSIWYPAMPQSRHIQAQEVVQITQSSFEPILSGLRPFPPDDMDLTGAPSTALAMARVNTAVVFHALHQTSGVSNSTVVSLLTRFHDQLLHCSITATTGLAHDASPSTGDMTRTGPESPSDGPTDDWTLV